MGKVSFDSLFDSNLPKVVEKFGDIEVYAINKDNFVQITKLIEKMHELTKDSEDNLSNQVHFVKLVFPVLTNTDMSKVTIAKIKDLLKSPSIDFENCMVFIFKYLTEFTNDYFKFTELLNTLPKKDFDKLSNGVSNEVMFEIFERNGLMTKEDGFYDVKNDFLKEFNEKYLR